MLRHIVSLESKLRERQPADLSSATDAYVAREFWRRFRPLRVLLGRNGDRVTYAEGYDDETDWLSGVSIDRGVVAQQSDNAEHADGEDGFVAALERARELVQPSGPQA